MIMTDDQTVESMRVMSNVRRLLGSQGTTFENSFVSFATCCPSRATFLTGQYAHNHRVLANEPPHGGYGKLDHRNTLPVWLRSAGYHTAHIGKYLNRYGLRRPREIPPGWSEWHAIIDPARRYYGYTLNENGRLVTYGTDTHSYQTDVYARKAVAVIRRQVQRRSPFFLSIGFSAPHFGEPAESDDPPGMPTPVPAPRHRDRFASESPPRPPSFNEEDVADKPPGIRRRPRLAPTLGDAIAENYRQELESLLAVDEAVASIVAALAAGRELDRTLIIFTSDNGYFHGEHRVPHGKNLIYEPAIRVPLIMRGPRIPRGERVRQLVSNIDLAPTILDAANVRAGRAMDGRSLLPLMSDRGIEWGRDLLVQRGPGTGGRPVFVGIRTRRYVYAEHGTGAKQLYDLRADPYQLSSLHGAASQAVLNQELARRLSALRRCRGRSCREGPRVTLELRYRVGRAARGGRCARSPVRAFVLGPERASIGHVDFYVGRRLVARDGRRPFRLAVSRRRLRSSPRVSRVRARVVLAHDRVVTLDRRVGACRRR